MKINKVISIGTGLALMSLLAIAVPAMAETNTRANISSFGRKDNDKMGSTTERFRGRMSSSTSVFSGNGMPIVAGSIVSINGSIITLTNPSNVTYTVDASTSKIIRGTTVLALSNLSVGDKVIVQGSVNGTSVTATTIIDGQHMKYASSTEMRNKSAGFFGGVGQFFLHLFGY